MQPIGVGLRFVAAFIDGIILNIIGYILAAITGQTAEFGYSLSGVPALIFYVLIFGYGIVLEATQGATVGKMAMGLKVVNYDGSPIDWKAAIIRNLLRIVDAIPYIIPYLTGAILIWTSDKKQRLGDRLANTIVVKKSDV